MVHAQILLFYSTIIGGLWQKNSHSKLGGAFPKREVSKSATATILTSRTNPGHVIMPHLSSNLCTVNYLIMHSIGTHVL